MVASDATVATLYEQPRPYNYLTPERIEIALEALAQGWSLSGAARLAGVDRTTLWRHQEANTILANAIAEAVDQGADFFEDRMRELALGPAGFLPTIATLKARRRAKWGDTQVLDISVHGTINVYNVASALAKLEQEREAAIAGECRVIGIEAPQGVRDTAESTDKGRSYDGNDST